MSWLFLFLAGLLEVVWAVGLKYSAGFTKLEASLITLVAMGASLYLLNLSLRGLPLSTAYAVWVGMGVVGTAMAGVLLLNEAITTAKVIGLALVVLGVVGLKLGSAAR